MRGVTRNSFMLPSSSSPTISFALHLCLCSSRRFTFSSLSLSRVFDSFQKKLLNISNMLTTHESAETLRRRVVDRKEQATRGEKKKTENKFKKIKSKIGAASKFSMLARVRFDARSNKQQTIPAAAVTPTPNRNCRRKQNKDLFLLMEVCTLRSRGERNKRIKSQKLHGIELPMSSVRTLARARANTAHQRNKNNIYFIYFGNGCLAF